MSDSDLIRRLDAMQSCQVGPSDEWSKATKDGYNQAATDCAMNILRIERVVPPTPAQIMADPRVKALVEALRDMLQHSGAYHPSGARVVSALAAFKEPKP